MTGLAASRIPSVRGEHRYGVVFLLVLVLVLFEVSSPAADWSRAVDVALAGSALTVAVATSRARRDVRRARALVVSGIALILVIGIATGVFGVALTFLVITLIVVSIPVTLASGLVRLIQEAGVTAEVVAGALAIYLLVGLLFASIVAFVAHVQNGSYFNQGHVPTGDQVYYSFTVLTTTGFGDYTAATPFGHALAVLEMLTGQLYLVTVIGVIVGNFVRRGRRPEPGIETHDDEVSR